MEKKDVKVEAPSLNPFAPPPAADPMTGEMGAASFNAESLNPFGPTFAPRNLNPFPMPTMGDPLAFYKKKRAPAKKKGAKAKKGSRKKVSGGRISKTAAREAWIKWAKQNPRGAYLDRMRTAKKKNYGSKWRSAINRMDRPGIDTRRPKSKRPLTWPQFRAYYGHKGMSWR